jgi:uncharacterized protein (DUF1330 family)
MRTTSIAAIAVVFQPRASIRRGKPMAVVPNAEQFAALAADAETHTGEVVMLNLLKYRSSGDDGGRSGAESYARYASQAVRMVEERGGRLVWLGRPDQVLIGDVEADDWDAVALVSYPSRAAFIDMVSQPDYQKAHEHRESGLDRTVLLAMTPETVEGFGTEGAAG